MFHSREGLYFEKLTNGCVRVVKRANANADAPIIVDVTLDKDAWASIIATMSHYGEEDYGFYRALNFHVGAEIPASCPLKEKTPARCTDGKRCPKCQNQMHHTRLAGYRCPRGCQ